MAQRRARRAQADDGTVRERGLEPAQAAVDDLSRAAVRVRDELQRLEQERLQIHGLLAGAQAQLAEREVELQEAAARLRQAETAIAQERGAFALQLAVVRERHVAELEAARAGEGEELRASLAQVRAELAQLTGRVEHGLDRTAGALARQRIVELEDELERARTPPRPAPPMPPADHAALGGAGDATADTAGSVIVDLARAAARLRIPPQDGPTDEEPGAPDAEVVLGPRVPRIGRRVPRRWLTPAIRDLAGRDPDAAAGVIQTLLPLQATRLGRDLTYDLLIAGRPELRVQLRSDRTASVALRPASAVHEAADVRLSGSAVALAPLVGGATRRRAPAGVAIDGSRRRARMLTRALRGPVGMAGIAAAPVTLAARPLLALLTAAIDPAATVGERFSVSFAEDDGPVQAHLVVADGRPIDVLDGAPERATATVRTVPGALAAFLAGEGSARVTGDADAVARFLAWADTAQGLHR